MSQPNGEPIIYVLYAVLVHTGFNCHAGHYFCYIKVSRGFANGFYHNTLQGSAGLLGGKVRLLQLKWAIAFFLHFSGSVFPVSLIILNLSYWLLQASNGLWYQMNDSIVSTSDIRSVLSQQAYVLFYIRYCQENRFSSFLLFYFCSSHRHI